MPTITAADLSELVTFAQLRELVPEAAADPRQLQDRMQTPTARALADALTRQQEPPNLRAEYQRILRLAGARGA